MATYRSLLALGSNIGDKLKNINDATAEIERICGKIKKHSRIYETEPMGIKAQPFFLNCCIEIETELAPEELLKKCLEIERNLGRVRREKNGPREIDIDILFYGGLVLDAPALNNNPSNSDQTELKIPHPGIQDRLFVLRPLAEIAPDFLHPISQKAVSQMLKECGDTSIVRLYGTASPAKTGEQIQN